jgi:hypothetical protein
VRNTPFSFIPPLPNISYTPFSFLPPLPNVHHFRSNVRALDIDRVYDRTLVKLTLLLTLIPRAPILCCKLLPLLFPLFFPCPLALPPPLPLHYLSSPHKSRGL